MESQWFYKMVDEQVGPVTGAQLKALTKRGEIRKTTPIANSPNGPWIPAGQVTGLFSGSGMTGSSPTSSSAGLSPADDAPSNEPSGLAAPTKIALAACSSICAVVVGYVVWYTALRDTWELHNADRVIAVLDGVDHLQKSNPLQAFKTYDELLKEAERHKLTNERFLKRLEEARQSRTALYKHVQAQIQAEESEKRRQAEEVARRIADEKQRAADEQARKLAMEEALRAAERKKRADEEQRRKMVSVYRDAPPSARTALNGLKRIQARTEVGMNSRDYSNVVGEAWADVKIFIESPEGKKLPEFSALLTLAINDYKLALDIWNSKIQYSRTYGDKPEVESLMQTCWAQGGRYINFSQSLLDPDTAEKALETFATLPQNEEDLKLAWTKLRLKLLKAD